MCDTQLNEIAVNDLPAFCTSDHDFLRWLRSSRCKPLNRKLIKGEQGYTTNTPLADRLEHDVLLAYEHDGEELPPEHGGWSREAQLLDERQVDPRARTLGREPSRFLGDQWLSPHADPWNEERYSDQETDAMQRMRTEAWRSVAAAR